MSINTMIAVLIFLMVQAVLFGLGTILVLATPLAPNAATLMPWVVGISFLISFPTSWWIAPHLRAMREVKSPLPSE